MANAAIYERLRRLANFALFAIALQCRRLNAAEPEDQTFVLRKWYDFEFLLIALTRLHRIAQQVAKLPEVAGSLGRAICDFEASLPTLKAWRNVAEHIDEYAVGEGHNRKVGRESLEVSGFDDNGPTLTWLGAELNAKHALRASEKLFQVIQSVGTAFVKYA